MLGRMVRGLSVSFDSRRVRWAHEVARRTRAGVDHAVLMKAATSIPYARQTIVQDS